MKYFKSLMVVLLLSIIIIPAVAFASWWNPLSWNWNIFDWFHPTVVQPVKDQNNNLNKTIIDYNKKIDASCLAYTPVNNPYRDTYCLCISDKIGNDSTISEQIKLNLANKFTTDVNEAMRIPKGTLIKDTTLFDAYAFCLEKDIPADNTIKVSPKPSVSPKPTSPQGVLRNVSLDVENTSQDINPIDIKISIDGIVKINQDFVYKSPQTFNFQLSEGKHHLVVISNKGNASLENDFTVTSADSHFAGVEYWYGSYPDVSQYPQPKHFSFSMSE